MTRQHILDTALALFAERGYVETSLKDIATAVGIKAPSIYAHFESKEELFAEVYTASLAEHTAYFRVRFAEAAALPPLERLYHLLTSVESYYRDRPDLVNFSLRATTAQPANLSPTLSDAFKVWDETFAGMVYAAHQEGCARGAFVQSDSSSFTALFLCLMDGLFLQLKHYAPADFTVRQALTWQQLSQLLSYNTETLHDLT